MKKKTLYCITIGVLFFLSLISCQQIDSYQKIEAGIDVLEAYKIPRLGGAYGSKGTRILLKVSKDNTVEIINLEFGSKTSEVSIIKSIKDTVWVESYFYVNNEPTRGSKNVEKKQVFNQCTLYYKQSGEKKALNIPSLILKMDTVLWK